MKPSSGKRKDDKKSRVVISVQDASSSEKTSKSAQRKKPAFEDLHARISHRAYELYVERGYREGYAEEDWLEAERQILDREFPA